MSIVLKTVGVASLATYAPPQSPSDSVFAVAGLSFYIVGEILAQANKDSGSGENNE